MNTTDAAYHTVHDYPGGSESLGPRVGISSAVLRNKVNVRTPREEKRHHLTFEEAQRIVAFTGDTRMLQAWAHAEGYLLVKAPDGATESDMSVLESVTGSVMEHGGFIGSIHASLVDGHLSPDEMNGIEAAAKKAMTAIVTLLNRLRGMAG